MGPRFERRGSFRVMGVEDDASQIEGVDPAFHDLWMNRYMACHALVQPLSTDGAHYGVWFGTRGTDISRGTYLAGMSVDGAPPMPHGWVTRDVPAAEYAVFETTLADVGDATEYALTQWLPESEYELDPLKPRFDLMPPETTGQESPMSVWTPVRSRE